MALTKKRYCYVDFTTTPQPAIYQRNLSAVMTAADDQVNSFWIDGHYFELDQEQAASSTAFTPSASGWLLPIGATDGDGLSLSQGSENIPSTLMKFTTGTDAFFIKVTLEQTTLADTDVMMVGFREAGTAGAVRTSTPALALTDYDSKALFGVVDNAGAMACYTSSGGSDTNTTPTNVLNVSGTPITIEVRVAADRAITVYVNGTEDALVTAAGLTAEDAQVWVPHIIAVSTGAGAEKVELVNYECGLLQS